MIDMRQHAVDDYLKRLKRSMRDIPSSRRDEILTEIRQHLEETLAHLPPDATDADVRTAIESVGSPDEIAAEAHDRLANGRTQARWSNILALVLLPIAGLTIPIFSSYFGWAIGAAVMAAAVMASVIIFLWMSSVWTTKEKLIGTLIAPGGLLLRAFLWFVPQSRFVTALLVGASAIAPIVAAVYLGQKLRRANSLSAW